MKYGTRLVYGIDPKEITEALTNSNFRFIVVY